MTDLANELDQQVREYISSLEAGEALDLAGITAKNLETLAGVLELNEASLRMSLRLHASICRALLIHIVRTEAIELKPGAGPGFQEFIRVSTKRFTEAHGIAMFEHEKANGDDQ